MARNTPILPARPAWTRGAVAVVAALVVLLAVGVLITSCGGGTTATTAGTPATVSGDGAGAAQVTIKDNAFEPATVTINAGESVTWTNQDRMNHTVAADNGEFQSNDLGQGATFTFTFDQAGTYPYHCSIHPSMKGTVVVQ